MNAEQYRQAGYRVSMQVSQAEISRAEADVTEAYIAKVMPTYSTTDTDVKAAMQVSYPKYEMNAMNYQRERNIGGAIHGLKTVAFGAVA